MRRVWHAGDEPTRERMARRHFLGATAAASLLAAGRAGAEESADLHFLGGVGTRPFTTAFPQKGRMILQRTRPPLLETPLEVFDEGVLTPVDRFYVRWHMAGIPDTIDVASYRVAVRGHVERPQSLSLGDLLALPRVQTTAVNQCAGNSRGYFQPRVPGAQWGHGAMGNARWTGVRLRDVLDRAGVRAGALQVRFKGLDTPVVDDAPTFLKSLPLDRARDPETMIAFQMNGQSLPLLNGFPIRLVVPGWFSTYWVKMLSDIEVLDRPDDNFWMKTAYQIPDTPGASVKPGEAGFKTVPINRLVVRSFVTNVDRQRTVAPGARVPLRGIAFGGDCGVAKVETSVDAGASWTAAALGADEGTYSFRRWSADITAPASGGTDVLVCATNTKGERQPLEPIWNGGGYMLNTVERVRLTVA